ncbi:MAG: DUF4367 domain-containing protein [Acinetobacter sp.]
MTRAQKKSKQRYLEWVQYQIENRCEMTPDDAFRILEGQFLLLDEEEIDGGLVDECLDYLIPNRAEREYPMEETWQRIVKKAGLCKEADDRQTKSRISHRRRLRPALSILVLLLVSMVIGTTIASALGYNAWEYVIEWTKDILRIETELSSESVRADNSLVSDAVLPEGFSQFGGEQDSLSRELSKNGFFVKLPTWKPDEFVDVQAQTLDDSDAYIMVNATYEHPDGRKYFVDVEWLDAPLSNEIEKKPDETPTIIQRKGTTFYVVTNIDRKILSWLDSPYMVTIRGDLTEEEIAKMIDSLFEEEKQ